MAASRVSWSLPAGARDANPQMQHPGLPPESKRPAMAVKELSDDSSTPALGITSRPPRQLPCRELDHSTVTSGFYHQRSSSPVDSMFGSPVDTDGALPRGKCNGNCPTPRQNEYPVAYFLHGDLAEPEHLRRILGLGKAPVLIRTKAARAKLVVWRPHGSIASDHRVEVLMDGSDRDVADGWTYMVNKDQEDTLRLYMGDKYDIVRCEMSVSGTKMQKALTFRFCAKDQESHPAKEDSVRTRTSS